MKREETWEIIRRIGWKKRDFSVPKTVRFVKALFHDLPAMEREFVEEVYVFQIALYEEILGADKKGLIGSQDCLRALTWHYVGLGRKAFEKSFRKPEESHQAISRREFPLRRGLVPDGPPPHLAGAIPCPKAARST